MTRTTHFEAQCSVMAFPGGAAGDNVPEWVNLLPAGVIRTEDGRGPYIVKSMQSLVRQLNAGGELAIDECHAIDKAKETCQEARARGWMTAFEERDGALWAKVDWTNSGRELMADRAYGGISPVILHSQSNEVLGVLRAGLTNSPNLPGLVALHSEETQMDWKAKLIELLGLDSGADDEAIAAALSALKTKAEEAPAVAEQSQLGNTAVVALQSQVATLSGELTALRDERSTERATAFVDGAIAAKRIGVSPLRDQYIAMHMANPGQTEAIINGLPKMAEGPLLSDAPPQEGSGGLGSADRAVIAAMGLDPEEYKARLAAAGKKTEAL